MSEMTTKYEVLYKFEARAVVEAPDPLNAVVRLKQALGPTGLPAPFRSYFMCGVSVEIWEPCLGDKDRRYEDLGLGDLRDKDKYEVRGPGDIGYDSRMTIPVLGDPDPLYKLYPNDPILGLPVVGYRRVRVPVQVTRDDHFAIIELEENPVGSTPWGDGAPWGTVVFIYNTTKKAAPGDAVVVLHEHKLAVRRYEPQDDGQVCLRSAEAKCQTWVLPAGEVNIQGVVISQEVDLHDSGWA
jgi:hypothetical protein